MRFASRLATAVRAGDSLFNQLVLAVACDTEVTAAWDITPPLIWLVLAVACNTDLNNKKMIVIK